jgi:hypothetical protein
MDFPELHQLLGVTYSQFDNTVGPQLLYEYPQGAISPDAFEAVSEYVIVGKHLCEKIIMVKVDNIKFLNFSVAIENSKVCYVMWCVLRIACRFFYHCAIVSWFVSP